MSFVGYPSGHPCLETEPVLRKLYAFNLLESDTIEKSVESRSSPAGRKES
jgi:hypothetical protein